MKLKKVAVRNFKGVGKICFSLETVSHIPRPLTALLGDNGSGKTTILQAIALTLSLATRRTSHPSSFRWHGFLPERLSSLGETVVKLSVAFEKEEVDLVGELYEEWKNSLASDSRSVKLVPPSAHLEVELRYERGRLSSPQGPAALHQFLGRYYLKTLMGTRPELREKFRALGDIFWFDQHRNLGSLVLEDSSGDSPAREGWQAGVEQLREYLIGWWGHHTSTPQRGRDFILPLQNLFQQVFPGTRFTGIMPRSEIAVPRAKDFYFLLEQGDRVYDLAEMSSGEQALFPLIYEFVRLGIQRSVVLIDELELHLHPPEQQRLLAALPKIGPDCQFIITTHSEFLASAIPNEQEVRLQKGMRCL